MFVNEMVFTLSLPDSTCNPSGSALEDTHLAPMMHGRTIVAAVLMFVMVVYSWYVLQFCPSSFSILVLSSFFLI